MQGQLVCICMASPGFACSGHQELIPEHDVLPGYGRKPVFEQLIDVKGVTADLP